MLLGERFAIGKRSPVDTVSILRLSKARQILNRLNLRSKAPFLDPTKPSEPSAGFAKRFIDGWFL